MNFWPISHKIEKPSASMMVTRKGDHL